MRSTKRLIRRVASTLEFFDQLAAIHAGHAVIADEEIGSIIHGLEERIGCIGRDCDSGERGKGLLQHAEHHRIVVDQKQLEIVSHESDYF
jgi:hypothetical protein